MFGSNPVMSIKRATMKNDDLLILARGHFELWQRMGLLSSEAYHLHRSKELFESFFVLEDEVSESQHQPPTMDRATRLARIEDLVIYCKVLQHCGEMATAAQVINVLALSVEGDLDYANYCTYSSPVRYKKQSASLIKLVVTSWRPL